MYKLVEIFLDLIYLPTYEEKIIRNISSVDIKNLYQPRTNKNTLVLSRYQNKYLKALIHCNKYRGNRRAAILLAHLLIQHFEHHNQSIQIVPIPLSKERYRERGFNQVETILSALKNNSTLNIVVIPALQRVRHTAPQTTLDKKSRENNLYQAFKVTECCVKIDTTKPIFILDDVHTTGATLLAAKQCLTEKIPPSSIVRLALTG